MTAWKRTGVAAAPPGWRAVYRSPYGGFRVVPVAAWVTDESAETGRMVTVAAIHDSKAQLIWANWPDEFVSIAGPGEDTTPDVSPDE